VPGTTRRNIAATALALALMTLAGCSGNASSPKSPARTAAPLLSTPARTSGSGAVASPVVAGRLTIAFAGDVHFADRTAARLAADPANAFGESAAVLSEADLTMVNLETAVAVGGRPENKSFTFEAPPTAFTALKDAGIDVATMANNHGADYGSAGLSQTLAAIKASQFPVVGIGANAAAAYAPYYATINGVRLALIAASQVQDETLAHFSATDARPGIANAYSGKLISSVKAARGKADLVIVYVHWGTEYQTCPNGDQRQLASALAAAGADAIIGTHAHVLQGAGWRSDGKYVAYGLGNYFWWRSFGNNQDDNGVLTLTVRNKRIASADFAPAHLDTRGISLPASGATKQRILNEWEQARQCAGLLAQRPAG
jgi:hypothetical protein